MPTTLSSLRDQIRSSLEAGDINAAAAACLIGLDRYPRWVEGHRFLGEINLGQEAFQAARDCFEVVASAEPDNATPYVGLGVVYEHEQRLREAVGAFERALDLDQADEEVRQELVRLYSQLHLSKVVETTRAGLAHQHLRGRQLSEALRELDELLSSDPRRLDLLLARARAAWLSGKLDVAEQTARQILTFSPDCVLANVIVGELLIRAGHADQAEPFLQTARELDPDAGVTSTAVEALASEGIDVSPVLPRRAHEVVVAEDATVTPHQEAAAPSVPEPADLLAGAPPTASRPSASPEELWPATPVTSAAGMSSTGQQGLLDNLLRELDKVWPERLDASQPTPPSVSTGAEKLRPIPPADHEPDDDDNLPPSFLGDVSEVIREFEQPSTLTLAHHREKAAANAASDDFPDEDTATQTDFAASDVMLSGERAIIDLTLPAGSPASSATDTGDDELRIPESDMFRSGERSVIDLTFADAPHASAGSPSGPASSPALGPESPESLMSGEHAVIDLGASSEPVNLDDFPPLEPFPVRDELQPAKVDAPYASAESDIAALTAQPADELDLPIARDDEPPLPDAQPTAGPAGSSVAAPPSGTPDRVDDGGPESMAEGEPREPLTIDWAALGIDTVPAEPVSAVGQRSDALQHDSTAGDLVTGDHADEAEQLAAPAFAGEPTSYSEADTSAQTPQPPVEADAVAPPVQALAEAAGPVSVAEPVQPALEPPDPLAEAAARLSGAHPEDGLRTLRRLLHASPEFAPRVLELVAATTRGGVASRAQVIGDAHLIMGSYEAAIASYTTALDDLRSGMVGTAPIPRLPR